MIFVLFALRTDRDPANGYRSGAIAEYGTALLCLPFAIDKIDHAGLLNGV